MNCTEPGCGGTIAAVDTPLADREPADITETLLRDCGSRTEGLAIESKYRAAHVRLRVLEPALRWPAAGNVAPRPEPLLGGDLDQAGVRTGLERCYRDLAHETGDMWARFDRANAIRPRSML
jgi:serine/threonine-protein kinase PknG